MAPYQRLCEGLYVGDHVVVNVTVEIPFSIGLRADQSTVRFSLLGAKNDTDAMVDCLRSSRSTIAGALRKSQTVLIHCNEGKQRSCPQSLLLSHGF